MPSTRTAVFVFSLFSATGAFSQTEPLRPVGQTAASTNLPVQRIGKDDLIGIQVYESPELTRSVRVLADGYIRLPMMKERIHVEGLFPADVEVLIAEELKREELLNDPLKEHLIIKK